MTSRTHTSSSCSQWLMHRQSKMGWTFQEAMPIQCCTTRAMLLLLLVLSLCPMRHVGWPLCAHAQPTAADGSETFSSAAPLPGGGTDGGGPFTFDGFGTSSIHVDMHLDACLHASYGVLVSMQCVLLCCWTTLMRSRINGCVLLLHAAAHVVPWTYAWCAPTEFGTFDCMLHLHQSCQLVCYGKHVQVPNSFAQVGGLLDCSHCMCCITSQVAFHH